MFDEGKVKVLRGVFSWALDGLGVFVMFASTGLVILGPRLLSVVLGLAALFMLGRWLFRAGMALR